MSPLGNAQLCSVMFNQLAMYKTPQEPAQNAADANCDVLYL